MMPRYQWLRRTTTTLHCTSFATHIAQRGVIVLLSLSKEESAAAKVEYKTVGLPYYGIVDGYHRICGIRELEGGEAATRFTLGNKVNNPRMSTSRSTQSIDDSRPLPSTLRSICARCTRRQPTDSNCTRRANVCTHS